MKCLVAVLSFTIFIVQIHAIYFLENNLPNGELLVGKMGNKSILTTDKCKLFEIIDNQSQSFPLNDNKQLYKEKSNQHGSSADCSIFEFVIYSLFKCGMAFFAGILISENKFWRVGVI